MLQSGFEHRIKKKILGENYYKEGIDGNDIAYTNISDIRINYRWECINSEMEFLRSCCEFQLTKKPTRELSFQKGLEAIYTRIKLRAVGPYYSQNYISVSQGSSEAVVLIKKALELRKYYQDLMSHTLIKDEKVGSDKAESYSKLNMSISKKNGVFFVYKNDDKSQKPVFDFPSIQKYWEDMQFVIEACSNSSTFSFSKRRLDLMSSCFIIHNLLNSKIESKSVQFTKRSGDQLLRVDTHVHAASAMTSKHLLHFIKKQIKDHPNTIVNQNGDTLIKMLENLGYNSNNLTLDSLAVKVFNIFYYLFYYQFIVFFIFFYFIFYFILFYFLFFFIFFLFFYFYFIFFIFIN